MAELKAMPTYIAAHRLLHDDHEYKPGDEVRIADEATVAQLRKLGALKLPAEMAPPEEIEARMARQEAEIEALKAQLAAALAADAQAGAGSKSAGKGGKAAAVSTKAEELAESAPAE